MTKMTFHIFANFLIVLFSYGKFKDKDGFLIRIKFHLGRAKGRDKSKEQGMRGESLNKGYFCKIPIFKQDTNVISNFWSDKILTTTIAISMPKNLYAGIFS